MARDSELDIQAARVRCEALEGAQEELESWHREFTVTLDDGHTRHQMDALEAGKVVEDAEAKARMAAQDLAEAQGRLRKANCDYGEGWISDDLECGTDVEPWCGKHAVLYYIKVNKEIQGKLAEAQETIKAVRERARQGRKIMELDMYLFAGDILTIAGEKGE